VAAGSGDQANVTSANGETARLPVPVFAKAGHYWSRRAIRQVSNKYAACSTSGM